MKTERRPVRRRRLRRPEGADWLDVHCWRCGSTEARPHRDGLLLCAPCREALFGRPEATVSAPGLSLEAYWEAHVLDRCWRCLQRAVEPEDDLGLCTDCRDALARPLPRAAGQS